MLGGALSISSPMSIAIPLGITPINVSVAGAVTIQLPSARGSPAGAMAIPSSYAIVPVTIIDRGGFAQSHPITILAAPGESIANISSIQIATNYAATILTPNIATGQWIVS